MELTGLHHVTAITRQATENLAFYTQTLGMRLVKKTVNQDDVSAYHLFYADAKGSPGTDMTFFDWPMSAPNRPGAGAISATALRVADHDALVWWAARISSLGIAHGGIEGVAGRATLRFADPEGQNLSLVVDGGAPGGTPWSGSEIPQAAGIRGLDAVTLTVRRSAPTIRTLVQTLGFRPTREYRSVEGHPVSIFEVGAGGPGTEVHVIERPDLPMARQGAGGVHHVAFRTPNAAEQKEWLRRVTQAGLQASDQINRFYFQSIYFREPNGILFEIATDGPGFAADEDMEHLGESLALPPFLEPRRAEIESGLMPL